MEAGWTGLAGLGRGAGGPVGQLSEGGGLGRPHLLCKHRA